MLILLLFHLASKAARWAGRIVAFWLMRCLDGIIVLVSLHILGTVLILFFPAAAAFVVYVVPTLAP